MAKKLQVISALTNPRVASAAGGNSGTAAVGSNTLSKLPIGAAATSVKLFVQNANTIYWTPPADGTDITAAFGYQPYTSAGTGKTGEWAQVSSASYVSNVSYVIGPYSASLAVGDVLHVYAAAQATTSGRNMTWTRKITSSEGIETGTASLTAKTNGESLTAGNNSFGFSVAGVLANTNTPGLVVFGHSVPTGTGVTTNQTYIQVAAQALGGGAWEVGQGGSTAGIFDESGNWEIARMAKIAFYHWEINAINTYAGANPAHTGAQYVAYAKPYLVAVVAKMKTYAEKVILCTEWFDEPSSSATALTMRASWNDYIRSAQCLTDTGADGYFDLAAVGENQPNLHTAKSGFTVGIHPGDDAHTAIGAALAAELGVGGRLNSIYAAAAASDGYVETENQPFYGAATSVGSSISTTNWFAWCGSATTTKLYRSGTGHISSGGSGSTQSQHVICSVPVKQTGVFEAISYAWNTSTSAGQGISVGFTSSASTAQTTATTASGGQQTREGYIIRIFVSSWDCYKLRSSADGGASTSLGSGSFTSQTSTTRLRVKVTRSGSGATQNYNLKIYQGATLVTNTTLTDSSAPAAYQGDMYAYIGTTGNSATSHPNGIVWDSASVFDYAPVTVDTVTGQADFEVIPGSRIPFYADAFDATPAAVSGETMTAAVASTTIVTGTPTVGASVATDASGRALFTGTDGLTVPATAVAGETVTITVTCGGVSDTVIATVVDAFSSGAGSGIGTGIMEIEKTITMDVTDDWAEVVDTADDSSISGRQFYIGLASEADSVFLRVGTSLPSEGDPGRLVTIHNNKVDSLGASSKLYIKSSRTMTALPIDLGPAAA